MRDSKALLNVLPYCLLSFVIWLGWYWAGEPIGAICTIAAGLLLALISQAKLCIKKTYICGILVNILGFNWLAKTIELYGGIPFVLSWLVFALFVVVSALQFLLFAWIYNWLPKSLALLNLALAWVTAEFLFPKIFPWELGHTLIGFPVLSQIADIAGTPLISLVLLLSCSMFWQAIFNSKPVFKLSALVALSGLVGAWISYGNIKIENLKLDNDRGLKISIIQANVAAVQEGNITFLQQNKERYITLSRQVPQETELLIWPESIVHDWVSVETKNVFSDARLPFFGPGTALLTGALTFETQEKFFNSAILIDRDGFMPTPYHKRILMPFGEYMPGSKLLPFLNEINANLAQFTAGQTTQVFEISSTKDGFTKTKISPLICYEDLIPDLSRDATKAGAELLVNLTNDAWFGTGPALFHHSLMARYRAIENGRFLIRSTNTGQTEIINPLGISIASLPRDSEGILNAEVFPQTKRTIFTDVVGMNFSWLLSAGVLVIVIVRYWRRARTG